MPNHEKDESKVSFKNTLNLPHTDFPIRATPAIDDAVMLERWKKENLSEKSFTHNQGKEKFILHDGPPYANGNIHIGHAYNKILKDIVCKAERMSGKQVPITPGWDCHGLPIELKVSSENPDATPLELKKKCREYAKHWIDTQREEFKKLGVLMDWDHPYLTMDYSYEASILEAFGRFVAQGYIERKNKTVPWCASCKTVLAAAEIEYQDRKDPSIFVLFPLEQKATHTLIPILHDKQVNIIVWTTTPWTLPLNRAVLIKPDALYQVLELSDSTYGIVGAQLADTLCMHLGIEKKVVAELHADQFIKVKATVFHPFINNLQVPIIPSDSVSQDEGTAFVHCAPGCGPEDYEVGIRHKLEIYSPISVDGKYTAEIQPQELIGMPVADGQIWVIKTLAAHHRLLFKTTIKHSYPHCWRCHQGLIFRATKQWFCDLSKNDLKNKTLEATKTIATYPEKSINRLQATLEGRMEWCLSRQRVWGVPIPALLCGSCDYVYTNQQFIDNVAAQVKKEGTEYWERVTLEDLFGNNRLSCPSCSAQAWIKEKDILDVWFESGISHFAVLLNNDKLAFPADMYLEGKDQHRAWFQSSLLTSMVLEHVAPMKTILTHGFTVDQQGRKMSKSLGNVISPDQMIKDLGTDGLRLWAASIDYADDAIISPALLSNVKEVLRKIRNTCRFLLSNLYDYHHEKDALSYSDLLPIDRLAIEELHRFNEKIIDLYTKYDFTAIFHGLADYCANELSSFYLDIIKDRLYVEKAQGTLRRSAQTACWYILDTLTKLMAPILSFNAEQISDFYQKEKKHSIHLQSFAYIPSLIELISQNNLLLSLPKRPRGSEIERAKTTIAIDTIALQRYLIQFDLQWDTLKEMRSAVLKAIEQLREQSIIKHSLEARVTFYFDPQAPWHEALQKLFSSLKNSSQTDITFFKEFFIVSQISYAQDHQKLQATEVAGFFVMVEKAQGNKCPRCWNWDQTDDVDHLCNRCIALIRK